MKKLFVVFGVLLALSGCAKSNQDAVGADDASKAILLMNIEEGYVFKAGKASVTLRSESDRASFVSLAARSGGPGLADRRRKNGIFSFRSQTVTPGTYSLTAWRFLHRRGKSDPPDESWQVTIEPGKIYYLGRFFANNLTQSSKLTDAFEDDEKDFIAKFPFLKGREVVNVSVGLAHTCWAQNVTREIVSKNDVLKDYVADCYR